MELVCGLPHVKPHHRGCALAIGNFDGLHRGHLALIARARALAAAHGVPSAVMIFEPMPREYFTPAEAPPRLSELRDKLRRLAMLGVDRVICVHFDRRLAACSAEDFIADVLIRKLDVRALVVGEDFRFGARRAGDVALLRARLGAESIPVEGLDVVHADDGERCSSTHLREALAQPDLPRAQRLLGRPYSVIGRVRHGFKLGRTLSMPTLNLPLRHRPALRLGVYAVTARALDASLALPGVASIGVRPTIGGTAPLLETHIFDHSGDWYGREVEITLHRFLRPELRFDSLEALAAQMQADAADARRALAEVLTPAQTPAQTAAQPATPADLTPASLSGPAAASGPAHD